MKLLERYGPLLTEERRAPRGRVD
ncbi:protein of unknown function [Thauera humireducens]|nr:protein of unknown function [Thauera humireducens]CAH1746215.1 protein of unknown function [Thauera humireducens]